MSQLANMIAADIRSIIATTAAAAGGARNAVMLNASNDWGLSIEALADAIEEKLAIRCGAVDGTATSGMLRCTTAITGAAAEADMTVTGITTSDEIVKVIGDTGGTPVDITSVTSITDTNDVQMAAGADDQTGNTVEVWWIDNSVTL